MRDTVTIWMDRQELYHGVDSSDTVSMLKRKQNKLSPAMDDIDYCWMSWVLLQVHDNGVRNNNTSENGSAHRAVAEGG